MQIQLDGEIVPNVGLGGLRLRSKLFDIQDLIYAWASPDKPSYELISPFEARYRLGAGAVGIGVDVRNGKVFKLSAYPRYKGKLFGKIDVGMNIRDAITVEPSLYYDEADGLIRCLGVKGLAIDLSADDPPPELVPTLKIAAISVFAEEVNTAEGQTGNW